ncbi:MAG: HEAT repeat domain-containing protein [Elusimicrobiota bacterium]
MKRTVILAVCLFASALAARAASLESAKSAGYASFDAIYSKGRIVKSLGRADDELMDLTRDADPQIRAAAAWALRDYVSGRYRVEDRLLAMALNEKEDAEVREAAIKSLSRASNHRAHDALIDLAKDRDAAAPLRVAALKALYSRTFDYGPAQDAALELLKDGKQPLEVRKGAAWSLFGSVGKYRSWSALLEVLQDDGEDASLRVEAARSLYYAVFDQHKVRQAVWGIAKDAREPSDLRKTTVLALHSALSDYRIEEWLRELAQDSRQPELRLAAITALKPLMSEEMLSYFHLARYPGRSDDSRRYRDPLQD